MSEVAAAIDFDPPHAEILRLLSASGLPTADIGTGAVQSFFGLRNPDQGRPWLGVIGVERHGTEALLRSLAVDPVARNRGIGARLVAAVEAWARTQGCSRVVLLTTDAQAYFGELGYWAVARHTLSKALAGSSQVASLCPTTATVMAKDLERP